jgi:protein involved in temperature-dependent protein secretion
MTGPSFKGQEFGEVILPVLCPYSWRHPSDDVRLGRATEWQELEGVGGVPAGQKMLIVDGEEEIPFLEVREITFTSAAGESTASDDAGESTASA